MAPRISVIVAVHNPGPHFDDLINSLLRQSLPPADFEVLLCDDGSDQATLARLDAVSAAHSHLTVLKLEHSGWPGTPRNAGIDAAAGKYLFFADHDDTFGDEALQRLVDYADENSSDVVVGRLTGVGRTVSRGMFAENVPNAVLGRDPLLDILTPHKLFRTAFVREHGIRFPDGKVRLEDHVFVLTAYFAAKVISILADYPCYYWTKRTDQPSASASLIIPEYYYRYLRDVLDIVEQNVGPGPGRDALLQHWYRGKVLKRLAGRMMLRYREEYRNELLDVVRPLVAERFGPEVDEYLVFPMRVRSALLRAGRVDGLMALAKVDRGLKASARVASIGWDSADRLRLEIEATVTLEDDSELRFEPTPAGWCWVPPEPIDPEILTADVLQAGPDLAVSRIDTYLRARHDGSDYVQPVEHRPAATAPGVLRTTVAVDPRTARAGRAVTRDSDLVVQVAYAGWNFGTAVRMDPELLTAAGLGERTIGRRVFTVGTRGSDRLVLRARRLSVPVQPGASVRPTPASPGPPTTPVSPATPMPPITPGPVEERPEPELRIRMVRQARRVVGQVRGRLTRFDN